MKRPAMILGARLLFWALSFLVYVTRGQKRLVLAKVRVGAVLLGLTGLSMSAGCAPKSSEIGQGSGTGSDGTTTLTDTDGTTSPTGSDGTTSSNWTGCYTGGEEDTPTDDTSSWVECYGDQSTNTDFPTTETVSTGVTTGTSTDTSTDSGTTDTVSTGVTTDNPSTSGS